MGNAWIDSRLPGVSHMPSSRRITMRGTGERLHTWHSFESKGYSRWSAERGARYLITERKEAHFVLHPTAGELVQILPMTTGARTLIAGTVHTNAHGTVHAQTEVIGDAHRPFTGDLTAAGQRALGYLLDFLRSHEIPDRWAGDVRPPAYPGPGVARFMPRSGQSGHTHHAAWRNNTHGDPGAIADPWSLVPGPSPVTPGLDRLGRYTVRPGDTLGEIARTYRTSVGALVLLNGISNPNRIDVGQRIYTRWVVSSGQTLSEIASRASTSVSRLVQLNGLSNPNHITVGQLIRLP